MGNDIPSEVIAFIQKKFPDSVITPSTTFSGLGLNEADTITLIMELENHFNIPPNPHDAQGIVTVQDAITLIQNKLLIN
jgi:acyl carrier protein